MLLMKHVKKLRSIGFWVDWSPARKRNPASLTERVKAAVGCFLLLVWAGCLHADADLPTVFSNRDSIANTRHNMTQRQPDGSTYAASVIMSFVRNDYGEVCVYCHTPHGANGTITAPLWNRTQLGTNTYVTYSQLNTSSLNGTVTTPGANSLMCLSCHDGTTAIDSIINMPGSGRYLASQASSQTKAFLDTWKKPDGSTTSHNKLDSVGCLSCHSPTTEIGATDFTVFKIGTDLRNDHPVGINYPPTNGSGTDFNTPGGTQGDSRYFDFNGNGRMDKSEIRVYDSGQGPEVECASCHDPHGVPSAGTGSTFFPTFLRRDNAGSAVCQTCHNK